MSDFVVEIKGLSRSFRDQNALCDVSFSVPRGVVFGLVGENGAGKTTLLRHILGLLRGPAGAVSVFGFDPAESPERVLSRIGYLSEDRDLPEWMRVSELLNYRAAFYPGWDHDYAAELVTAFDLSLDQKVQTLSRGQLARVGLLLAIAYRPELLILDEPSSGLDPIVRRDILAAIIRTVADEGRTVVFSSHLLDEVQRVSDHVAMLNRGRLLLCQPLDDVLQQHTRCVFRLPPSESVPSSVPGTLSCTQEASEYSVICNGAKPEFDSWLKSSGGTIIEESSPSLEQIFVAHGCVRST